MGEAALTKSLPVPRVTRAWYPLCTTAELTDRPLKRTLYGVPLVVFRDGSGKPGVLLDRCPHRNVPLSMGAVVDGRLRCAYHGWSYDVDGRCRLIPSFLGESDNPARCTPRYAAVEQQGLVWAWGAAGEEPVGTPFRFRHADDPGYTTIRKVLDAPAQLAAVVENALDVPHTRFLHGGLFRSEKVANRITAVVQRFADHVECEYVGEPRPTGLAARLLSPSGGVVTHFDRFYLPSVLEVEYRIGDENHIVLNAACLPMEDHVTRLFAVVSVRSRVPGWLLRPFVEPIALRIFGQDVVVLRAQTATTHAFGEERFVSTEIDLLGPHVALLLKRAERGESVAGEPWRREVALEV